MVIDLTVELAPLLHATVFLLVASGGFILASIAAHLRPRRVPAGRSGAAAGPALVAAKMAALEPA